MPTNLVKTESDERLWRQAKALAAKNGHKENWGYIVSIYQTMKGRDAAKQAALYCLALNPEYVSLSMCPENRKATTDNRRDTGTGQQSASRQTPTGQGREE